MRRKTTPCPSKRKKRNLSSAHYRKTTIRENTRHVIWVYPNGHSIARSNSTSLKTNFFTFPIFLVALASLLHLQSCGIYSMTGTSTSATNMQVDLFYNNTDLGPANLGTTFTNRLKEYYQRNSSLKIVPENGQLQIDGVITSYTVTPVAPVSSGSVITPDAAAMTRLTIAVQANYNDTLEPGNSFKNKSFSFYADFRNDEDLEAVR